VNPPYPPFRTEKAPSVKGAKFEQKAVVFLPLSVKSYPWKKRNGEYVKNYLMFFPLFLKSNSWNNRYAKHGIGYLTFLAPLLEM
jgi:hypothetical protein